MAEALFTRITEINTKENGIEVEEMVQEFSIRSMDVGWKGSGKMVYHMERLYCLVVMGGQKNENMCMVRKWINEN